MKTLSSTMLKKLLIFLSAIIIILIGYFVIIPFGIRAVYSGGIPELPNFKGYPDAVKEYIEQKDSTAQQEPYSDDKAGRLGMAYQANFFYDEAEKCYSTAIKLNDSEWRWYYFNALIKEELGDSKATIESLTKALVINPEITYAWFRLGNSYFNQNNPDSAEIAFNKVISLEKFEYNVKTPDNGAFPLVAYAGYNLCRIYYRQKKIDQTKSAAEKLVNDYPTFGPAYRLLGQVYVSEGNIEKGNDYTTRAGDFESYLPPADPIFNELVLYSRNSPFILKQIDLARRSQNFLWAEDLCRHILNYDPEDMDAVNKYILLMLESFHYKDLEAKLKQYYDHFAENAGKLREIAQTLYRWNQNRLALGFLERAIALNPNEAESHVLYLRILAGINPDEALLEHCKKAISLINNNSELLTEYGRILALLGKKKEAEKQFNMALSVNPNNEVTIILLGVMAQQKGDVNTALNYYQRSAKINPLNVNTILTLVNYLIELKRWDDVFRQLSNSLDGSPNSIELLERYALVLAACPDPRLRNTDAALELAKRISFIRKATPEQDVNCAITLAIAYAGAKDYNSAIRVLNNAADRAKRIGAASYIPKIEESIKLFEAKKPYRL